MLFSSGFSDSADHSLPKWPIRGRALRETLVAYVSLVLAGLFLGWLMVDGLSQSDLAEFDVGAVTWLEERRSAMLNVVTDVGSGFSDTVNMVILVVAVSIGLAYLWRRWLESLLVTLALVLETTVFLTVSSIIDRDRPPVEQMDVSPPTAAFPSGHAGAAAAFYAAIALVIYWNTERKWLRASAIAGVSLIAIAVAFSRVYRGMHYPSDVVFGILLGLASMASAAVISVRATARHQGGV